MAKYVRRRRVRKSKGKGPLSIKRKKTVVSNNFASVVETVSLTDICGNTPYAFVVNLQEFTRAKAIALQYQEYRFVKTEYRLMADDNMYTNDGADGTIPYIYSIPNNGGEIPPFIDVPWLEQNGAKPRKLTGITKMSPRPRVSNATANGFGGGYNPAQYSGAMNTTSPWLRTYNTVNTSGVISYTGDGTDHFGLFLWLFQKTAGTVGLLCELDVTVTIQFRKPLAVYNTSGAPTVMIAKKE